MRIRDEMIYIQLLEVRSKFNKARYYMSQEEIQYSRFISLYCTHFLYSSRSPYLVYLVYPCIRLIENPMPEIIRVIRYFSHDYALDGKPFGFLTRRAIS